MSIISKLGNSLRERKEKKNNARVEAKTQEVLNYITGKDKVSLADARELVNIATKQGVNLYDLVDKGSNLSNEEIVNIAVRNQPELVLELDDKPRYQDLISVETFIEAFANNPMVILSNCKALKEKIEVVGKNADGTEKRQKSNLRAQCLRALNMYYRPKTKVKNGFNDYAIKIVEKIEKNAEFEKNLQNKRILTRSTTVANESIKKDASKSKYFPADALKLNNNKVLFLIPRTLHFGKLDYEKQKNIILEFLKNPSLNAFENKTKEKFVKRCVKYWPEIYFELKNIQGLEFTANSLTVQLSAYATFSARDKDYSAKIILKEVDEERAKKILAKEKANNTRYANKIKAKELELKK